MNLKTIQLFDEPFWICEVNEGWKLVHDLYVFNVHYYPPSKKPNADKVVNAILELESDIKRIIVTLRHHIEATHYFPDTYSKIVIMNCVKHLLNVILDRATS